MLKKINIKNAFLLFEFLKSKKLLKNEKLAQKTIIVKEDEKVQAYTKGFLGFGAFLTALCIMGILHTINLVSYNNTIELFIWGLLFIVFAILFKRSAGDDKATKEYSFIIQLSFAFMFIGKFYFVWGFTDLIDTDEPPYAGLLLATLLTYNTYKMPGDRFLSTFITLMAMLISIKKAWIYNVFFLFQLMITGFLLTNKKLKSDYMPLAKAFVMSFAITTWWLVGNPANRYWEIGQLGNLYFIKISLVISFIMLFFTIPKDIKKIKMEPFLLASVLSILLGIIPGILLGIILMLLGYLKHEKFLISVGGIFIPICLFTFYYNLDITLMTKSIILIINGIVLILGSFYMKHKGWDKGENLCIKK